MIRAWLLLFTLAISVAFNFIYVPERKSPNDLPPKIETVKFPFSDFELSEHTFWSFLTKYGIIIIYAICFIINDSTPRWLLVVFIFVCILDLIHFRLFYRSDGSGYNILRVLIFGLPTVWIQFKNLKK